MISRTESVWLSSSDYILCGVRWCPVEVGYVETMES